MKKSKVVYVITENWYQYHNLGGYSALIKSDNGTHVFNKIEDAINEVKDAMAESVKNGESSFDTIEENDYSACYIQKDFDKLGIKRKFIIDELKVI